MFSCEPTAVGAVPVRRAQLVPLTFCSRQAAGETRRRAVQWFKACARPFSHGCLSMHACTSGVTPTPTSCPHTLKQGLNFGPYLNFFLYYLVPCCFFSFWWTGLLSDLYVPFKGPFSTLNDLMCKICLWIPSECVKTTCVVCQKYPPPPELNWLTLLKKVGFLSALLTCVRNTSIWLRTSFFFLKGEDVWMKADKQTEASTVAAAAAALRNKTALFKTKHSGPLSWSPLPFQPSPSGADPAELTINITWIINYPLLFLWLVFLET